MSEMPYGFLHMVSIDDEISEFTIWGCFHCGYEATENEAEECICEKCWKKTKTKLKDHETEYWWCFTCNETFQQ